MARKYFIAPGAGYDMNTLAAEALRLPLGHSVEDPNPDLGATLFWVTIPTRSGGKLTVHHEGGGQVVILDDADNLLAGPAGTVDYDVPFGWHGELYVVASAGSVRKVSCKFEQIAFAREAPNDKAPPLIPWNFYFWPCARQFSDKGNQMNPYFKTVDQMLAKYAQAFGKDVKATLLWEVQHHQQDFGPSWLGHCHFSAAASVLFEQPPPQSTGPRGVTFSDEELKFLAAEWYGGFGSKDTPFALDANTAVRPWPKLMPKATYTMLLKPSELDPPSQNLESNLQAAILAYKPDFGADAATMAKNLASRPSKIAYARAEFGRAATVFFQTLNDFLVERKHPLVSDLRGNGAHNTPDQVWNHAIFYYKATFCEVLPTTPTDPIDDHFMEIDLTLVANEDVKSPPSSSIPARPMSNGLEVESSSLSNRKSCHLLRLAFDPASGKVKEDPRNQWKYSRNKNGEDLYAPMFLGVLQPAGTTPGKAIANHDPIVDLANGNVMVDLDLVKDPNPLLKVRQRYKK